MAEVGAGGDVGGRAGYCCCELTRVRIEDLMNVLEEMGGKSGGLGEASVARHGRVGLKGAWYGKTGLGGRIVYGWGWNGYFTEYGLDI